MKTKTTSDLPVPTHDVLPLHIPFYAQAMALREGVERKQLTPEASNAIATRTDQIMSALYAGVVLELQGDTYVPMEASEGSDGTSQAVPPLRMGSDGSVTIGDNPNG